MATIDHVVVVLALMSAAQTQEGGEPKTVGELFLVEYSNYLEGLGWRGIYRNFTDDQPVSAFEKVIKNLLVTLYNTSVEFLHDFSKVSLESVYEDLNQHCDKYLETPIKDLRDELKNATCVNSRLEETFTSMIEKSVEVAVEKFFHNCCQQLQPSCSLLYYNCSTVFQKRFINLFHGNVDDRLPVTYRPVDTIRSFALYTYDLIHLNYFYTVWVKNAVIASTQNYTEPLTLPNLIRRCTNWYFARSLKEIRGTIATREQLRWGIVSSSSGSVHHPCSIYRHHYTPEFREYGWYHNICYKRDLSQALVDFIICAYKNEKPIPLAWSTSPTIFFHSQCLCVAFNGSKCGVKTPKGVDPHLYCLSVLLRDFQKHVSHRPAATYLDYALMTRVPVCQFISLLPIAFDRVCDDTRKFFNTMEKNVKATLSVQCYFDRLFNKKLNCPDSLMVKDYDASLLCGVKSFTELIFCEGAVDGAVRYYEAGDSWLVEALTYVEAGVRVLALLTFLACAQLRNLPGKLLICYQVTALLRLVTVRASLEDLGLATRLDVACDLASTLWLCGYLHFLTSSIRTLRLPDSLSSAEALAVFLRCALLGWALPSALSAAFFSLDDALDGPLALGQLLFVLCNSAALLANLSMFLYDCKMFYDIRHEALPLRAGATARSLFADVFKFALKTSVLSGAGISLRLVFTQIPDLEHLLSYYHALGTLQALLFFLLYGCSREARAFWRLCCTKTLSLLRLNRQTVSP